MIWLCICGGYIVHMQRSTADRIAFLRGSLLYILRQHLSLNPVLVNSSSCTLPVSSEDSLSLLSGTGITACLACTPFLKKLEFWGSEPWSSHLCSNYFINWAISPDPVYTTLSSVCYWLCDFFHISTISKFVAFLNSLSGGLKKKKYRLDTHSQNVALQIPSPSCWQLFQYAILHAAGPESKPPCKAKEGTVKTASLVGSIEHTTNGHYKAVNVCCVWFMLN